ncbi:MAG: hypothetical protein K2W96_04570, partial [Gemmataceae bacterium]|nr:hypothetical protein [Gemmataceae bacterium]
MHDPFEEGQDEAPRPSLRDRFPTMRPLAEVPTVGTLAGCGLGLSGRREPDAESGSFVSSHCLMLLGLPVWALAAYRVQRSPRGNWQFLGRVPLTRLAWASNAFSLLLAGFLAFLGVSLFIGSADRAAAAKLAEAERDIADERPGSAAAVLREVMEGKTKHADEARKRLEKLARD